MAARRSAAPVSPFSGVLLLPVLLGLLSVPLEVLTFLPARDHRIQHPYLKILPSHSPPHPLPRRPNQTSWHIHRIYLSTLPWREVPTKKIELVRNLFIMYRDWTYLVCFFLSGYTGALGASGVME